MKNLLTIGIATIFAALVLINPTKVEAAPPPITSIVFGPSTGGSSVDITCEPVPGAIRYGFVVDNNTAFGGSGGYYVNEWHDNPVVHGFVENIPKFNFKMWAFNAEGEMIVSYDIVTLDNTNYVPPQSSSSAPSSTTSSVAATTTSKTVATPVVSSSASISTSSESSTTSSNISTSETTESSTNVSQAGISTEKQNDSTSSEKVIAATLIGGGVLTSGALLAFIANKFGWLAKLLQLLGR